MNHRLPIGKLAPSQREVHIWGGGFAGLTLAVLLSRKNFTVNLYEKSDRLGGKLGTTLTPNGVVEWAANAFFADESLKKFLASLDLKLVTVPKGLRRLIYYNQKLHSAFSIKLLKYVFKAFLTSPPVLDSETTLADFFLPLLGQEKIDHLLSPAVQGIYGCEAAELNFLSLYPELQGQHFKNYWQFKKALKKNPAQSVSFEKGMQEALTSMSKHITGKIFLSHQLPFDLKPNTIICTNAHEASELLKDLWPEGSAELKKIQYLPLTSWTFFLKNPLPQLFKSFGILFPTDQKATSLGVLCNHEIFPQRLSGEAKASLTFIVRKDKIELEDLKNDFEKCGFSQQDLLTDHKFVYPKALPLYDQTRLQVVEKLHSLSSRPQSLILFGNYVAGISLREMYQAALNLDTEADLY